MKKELVEMNVGVVSTFTLENLFELKRWFWKDPMVCGNVEEKTKLVCSTFRMEEKIVSLFNESLNDVTFYGIREMINNIVNEITGKEFGDNDDILDFVMFLGEVQRGVEVLFGILNMYDAEEGEYVFEVMKEYGWLF
jgi:hypothetical protein